MHGVELLIANCDHLKSLMDLTYFEGISEEELQQFEQKIVSQNLDLRLKETKEANLFDSDSMNQKLKDKCAAFDNSIMGRVIEAMV